MQFVKLKLKAFVFTLTSLATVGAAHADEAVKAAADASSKGLTKFIDLCKEAFSGEAGSEEALRTLMGDYFAKAFLALAVAWISYIVASAIGRYIGNCLLYTSPSPRDKRQSRMPSSA